MTRIDLPLLATEPAVPAGMAVVDAELLALRLRALADPTRVRLVSIIAAYPDGEACVCHLTDPVGLSQPTVSHHLKLLVDAGILERDKRGVWAYYRLVPGAIAGLGESLMGAVGAVPVG